MAHTTHEITVPPHDPELGTLPNGLEYIIKEIPDAPVASIQVWCRAGSIHEGDWLGGGMAHLLEHMLFKGTERRGTEQIPKEVQSAGGHMNAYTSFDRTVYWIDVPPDGFSTCLDILADMTLHSILPKDEFIREQEVIRREMAMGDDSPARVCSKLMFATAYQVHPCRYPVIGYREVFDRISHDDLQAFYHRCYVPNNLFVVIAGPVDSDQVREQLEEHFGPSPRAPLSTVSLPGEPAQWGRRVRRLETQTQLTHSRIAWQARPLVHADTPALDVLSTILGSGRSSRLYKEVREKRQLAHSIGAYLYPMSDTGLFVIAAEADDEKSAQAGHSAIEVVEKLAAGDLNEADLNKATHQTLSDALGSLTTSRDQASDMGSSWLLTGNPDFTSDYLKAVQQVTESDVARACQAYLPGDRGSFVSIHPAGGQNKRVKRASAAGTHTEKRTLSNGLTLLVRPDSRLPLVHIHAAFRGGLLAESRATAGITRLFSRMLTRDTHASTSAEVAERIESVGGQFSAFSGYNSFGLNAETMSPDWLTGLEIVGEGLLSPAFREETLEREQNFQKARIRAELDRPTAVAAQAMRAALFSGHAYSLPLLGTEDSVDQISPDELRAFQHANLSGANGVLSVYGDVEIDAVQDAAEGLLEKLGVGGRRFEETGDLPAFSGSITENLEHDKQQAILILGFRTGGVKDDDSLALELIDEACSDMSSRLYTRIREELGLAYMVGSGRMLGLAGGCFYFYVATAPEKTGVVEAALHDEVAYLAEHGLGEDVFERAKKSWIGAQKNQLQSLSGSAQVQTLDELFDFGWNHCHKTPRLVEEMDHDHIQKTAARYFSDQPHALVCLTRPDSAP